MDKYIGKVLDDRYEIISVIGVGGMANVYKARCRRLSRNVAIKILKAEHASDPEFKRRFKNESNAVARMSHKNIVNVYDVSNDDALDYIVMELIEGITLKEYLNKKEKLDWKQVLFFTSQIAEALDHAHSRGIIHQDIKPQNIMLLRDGTIKVADFGIAKLEHEKNETKVIKEAIGSVHYISPEQAKGNNIDNRTDLYSLGVVMYEMLTGKPPYEGETAVSIVMQHINSMPTPIASIIDMPKALEEIILKAMSPSLKNRYSSAKEMLVDLEKVKENPNILLMHGESSESQTRIMSSEELHNAKAKEREERRTQNSASSKKQAKKRKEIIEDDDDDEEYYKPRRRTSFLLPFIIVIAIAYVAVNYMLENILAETEEIFAPDLVDRNVENVIGNDIYEQYNIEIIEEIYNELEEGTILKQEPVSGSKLASNHTIYLTVSLGLRIETVPDLEGYQYSQAEIELERLGLVPRAKFEYSVSVEEGKVMSTYPEGGTEVSTGDTVDLYISAGREISLSTVPEVRGYTLDEAKSMLTDNGLDVGTITYEQSLSEEGTVIAQSADAGQEMLSGYKVNLVVAEAIPEPEPDPEQDPELDPEAQMSIKSVLIKVPTTATSDDGQILIEVFADNTLVYANFHEAGDASFSIDVTGINLVSVRVYADSEEYYNEIVVFD